MNFKARGQSVLNLRRASERLRELKAIIGCPGPLVAFDLEGTGPFRDWDRICEIGIVKLRPDDTYAMISTLINPGIRISDEARDKHGISDADVQDAPRFAELAPKLAPGLRGCALVGYNLRGYDIPVLTREFRVAGYDVALDELPVIDGFSIYQQKAPRDLTAAVREYCGREREEAHEAGVDVLDTVDVILGQLRRFEDLPRTVDELATFCDRRKPEYIDRAGKFQWRSGVPIVAFSRHAGTPMELVDAGFYEWLLRSDFPSDTKAIASRALDGIFPMRARSEGIDAHAENEETEANTGAARGPQGPAQGGLFHA